MFAAGNSAAATAATYIEDVFSTYLYTGTGANQTFNNGVDLSTKGGMVWIKQRSSPVEDWRCVDSARGITNGLQQNLNNAQQNWTGLGYVTSFNTNGFSIGTNVSINTSAYTYASWTFRKQPKFFDVVTYTGNGTDDRAIAHSLGSVPGCYIVKAISTTSDWLVYHRGNPFAPGEGLRLNGTDSTTSVYSPANIAPTSTNFYAGRSGGGPTNNGNINGVQYVAYLFAHNAGGFGLTGTDNVISCGSYTSSYPSKPSINLGWEPQFVLIKAATQSGAGSGPTNWVMFDNMRGVPTGGNDATLLANTSGAEFTNTPYIDFNATGFTVDPNGNGYNDVNYPANNTYIYIAIRRGPMKVPTSGTSIYGTQLQVNTPTYSFPPDLIWATNRTGNTSYSNWFVDRLRGSGQVIRSYSTGAETAESYSTFSPDGANNSWGPGWTGGANYEVSGFRRAPGFFDEVCFTATGSTFSVTHNLGVAPELVITKERNGANAWYTYSATYGYQYYLSLNGINAKAGPTAFFGTGNPTSTTLSLSGGTSFFSSGQNYVAYLFASCPGVSKVGSYSGTGATQTINCGFAARFVLIKRTDSTGNWVVWDTSRGMVAGTDPRLELNTTNAETNANWVYTDASGFQIVTTDATVNASGGSYIFLAIA